MTVQVAHLCEACGHKTNGKDLPKSCPNCGTTDQTKFQPVFAEQVTE